MIQTQYKMPFQSSPKCLYGNWGNWPRRIQLHVVVIQEHKEGSSFHLSNEQDKYGKGMWIPEIHSVQISKKEKKIR